MMNNQINTTTNKTQSRGAFKQPILDLLKNPKLTHKEIATQVGCTLDLVRYYCRNKVKNKSLTLQDKIKKYKGVTLERFNQMNRRDKEGNYLCAVCGLPINLDTDKWALREVKTIPALKIYLMTYSIEFGREEKEKVRYAKHVLTSRRYKVMEPEQDTVF